jgi:hypothetical protein
VKPAENLKPTKRNVAAVAKYAGLAGVTPEKFLNRFLQDFLVERGGPGCFSA